MIMVCALALDYLFGEVRRFHPLVGFGAIASWFESKLNVKPGSKSAIRSVVNGAFSWMVLCLVLPLVLAGVLYGLSSAWVFSVSLIIVYFCIAPKSLAQHAYAVEKSLAANDIVKARSEVGKIVSRDCTELDSSQVATASVESVLENGSDAVIAAFFWFLLLGAPGILLYRLANTLDAMWGYRVERFNDFGFAAAKIDDLLNWIPARLCAFLYATAGDFLKAMRCWHGQAKKWSSPNAGPVMASGAGALNLKIGGIATYHEQEELRPTLGIGKSPNADDIRRSVNLVNKATAYFVLVILLWELGLCYLGMGAI